MRKIPTEAFEMYVGMGVGRSYQAVADRFGCSKRAVTKHAKINKWSERLNELLNDSAKASEAELRDTVREMNTRHLYHCRSLQLKALEAAQNLRIENIGDLIKVLNFAVTSERLVRGKPTKRTAVLLEKVVGHLVEDGPKMDNILSRGRVFHGQQ